ncbi:unnamed protein product, partial [Symbiodinium necroappetens]
RPSTRSSSGLGASRCTCSACTVSPRRPPAAPVLDIPKCQAERRRRASVVDQSAIAHGQRSLLEARKVVYAIVSRDSPHLQVCVTKVSCAQDFLERAARELRATARGGSFTQSSKHRYGAAKTGLAFQAPEGLLLYALESLESAELPYHRLSQQRLHHWAKLLQGVTTENAGDPRT